MHIIWRNTTVIRNEESLFRKNSGWLAEWNGERVEIVTLDDLIEEMTLDPYTMVEMSEPIELCER